MVFLVWAGSPDLDPVEVSYLLLDFCSLQRSCPKLSPALSPFLSFLNLEQIEEVL